MHIEPAGVRVDPALILAHAERDAGRQRDLAAAVERFAREGEARAARLRAAVAAKHRSALELATEVFARRATP